MSKLIEGAISGLRQNSVDDRLLEFIGDIRHYERLHQAGQPIHSNRDAYGSRPSLMIKQHLHP